MTKIQKTNTFLFLIILSLLNYNILIMLFDSIPRKREEKHSIFISKEKYSKPYEWVLVLEEWNRYIIVTKNSDCFLWLEGYAFIDSNTKVKILWYRENRLNLNSQLKVYHISFTQKAGH